MSPSQTQAGGTAVADAKKSQTDAAQQNAPVEGAQPARVNPHAASSASPSIMRCEQVDLRGEPLWLCVAKPKVWDPYLVAFPGVAVAILGFVIVHGLSVRRQRRDEQFKMVQATRELVTEVAREAETAWADRKNRATAGPILIQRVARIGRAIQQLRVRHQDLDVAQLVTGFRQAVTLDFEAGQVSVERRAEIVIAAAELEEQIMLQFLQKYG